MHHKISDTEFAGRESIRVPYGKIAGVVCAILASVALFELIVPSKATVSQNTLDIAALKVSTQPDHDTTIKVQTDVEYIRHWVEQQEDKQDKQTH